MIQHDREGQKLIFNSQFTFLSWLFALSLLIKLIFLIKVKNLLPGLCKWILIVLKYLPSKKHFTHFKDYRLTKKIYVWADKCFCFCFNFVFVFLILFLQLKYICLVTYSDCGSGKGSERCEEISNLPLFHILQIKECVARFLHDWAINTRKL